MLVGVLFGVAGAGAHSASSAVRVVSAAAAPAIVFAETLDLLRVHDRAGAGAEAVFGLVVAVVVIAAFTRRGTLWAWTIGATALLAVLGAGCYAVAGYGG